MKKLCLVVVLVCSMVVVKCTKEYQQSCLTRDSLYSRVGRSKITKCWNQKIFRAAVSRVLMTGILPVLPAQARILRDISSKRCIGRAGGIG